MLALQQSGVSVSLFYPVTFLFARYRALHVAKCLSFSARDNGICCANFVSSLKFCVLWFYCFKFQSDTGNFSWECDDCMRWPCIESGAWGLPTVGVLSVSSWCDVPV